MGIYRIASLRKRGRRIADRILHGKAFLELLLEGFAKRLGIKGLLVFILELVEVMRWVLDGTVAFDRGRNELVVGTWAIENASEVRPFH